MRYPERARASNGAHGSGDGDPGPSNSDPIASLLFEIENLLSDTEIARNDVYRALRRSRHASDLQRRIYELLGGNLMA